jgi:basic amino acid/polyamine antiporter, APA family
MLKRSIGKWEMVLLFINGVIGAGIFGLPSRVFQMSGVYSILALLLCMAAIFIIVLCFAEVSSRFHDTGGPYLYALSSFGPLPAFLTGWLLLITRFITYAALINLLVTYLGVFSPWFIQPMPRIGTITAITLVLGYINHIGIRNSTRANNLLTVGKLIPLLVFIGVGFFFVDADRFQQTELPEFSNVSATALLWIFAFGGFESVLVNSGEVKNPARTLPFALMIATLCIATIYILILLVSIGTLPGLAASDKPLSDAAALFMGKKGATLIALGALVSITGTLNAIMLVGSRLPYAFSEQGQFPKIFSRVHPKYATPVWSLWAFAAVTLVVSINQNFVAAATLSAITRVMIYAIICIALLRLRKTNIGTESFLRLRYGPTLAWLALPIIGWLLSSSKQQELISIAIALAVGLVIYFIVPKSRGVEPQINNPKK